jgi:DNA repair exonuclease SbcCD ATPase subunit
MCVSALLEFLTMTFAARILPPVAGLAALLATAFPGARSTVADPADAAIAPVVQAWLGTTALLAPDGEREEGRGEGRRSREWNRGERGGERSRGDQRAMMNEIMARLARIERMLAERGPGGPPAGGPGRGGDWRGRSRPQMTPEMRQQWEARMKEGREKMEAARDKWKNASEEERAEMKKQWEARMKEGREKMEAARDKWKNASEEERAEMKKQWEGRLKELREKMAERRPEEGKGPEMSEEARAKMAEARRMVDDARKRAAEMEARVKRLEAELERMKSRKKGSADEEF